MSEDAEQATLVAWFRLRFPGVRIFHIPNGGHRNLHTGARLKRMGVMPGVPDLFVPEWLLWIECKTKKGRASAVQRDWRDYLTACDYTVLTPRGLDAAMQEILKFANCD